MNWEQKLQALMSLGEFKLNMRRPGDWYVYVPAVEIKDGHILKSGAGNGRTPEEAVDAYWSEVTELSRGERLVVGAYSENRREVLWNGFMWEDVKC